MAAERAESLSESAEFEKRAFSDGRQSVLMTQSFKRNFSGRGKARFPSGCETRPTIVASAGSSQGDLRTQTCRLKRSGGERLR